MIAAVETIWQGSAKDYEVIQQIFVQLKKEVAEATLRMSKANKYSWGQATADHEENGQPKGKGKGKGGKGRRGSGTDAEKEPKKEDHRPRSASETDISEAWKKQNPHKINVGSIIRQERATLVINVDLTMMNQDAQAVDRILHRSRSHTKPRR